VDDLEKLGRIDWKDAAAIEVQVTEKIPKLLELDKGLSKRSTVFRPGEYPDFRYSTTASLRTG